MPSATASTVAQPAVALGRLDRVPDGVAEVEQRARAGLALVLGDDARLERRRHADRARGRLAARPRAARRGRARARATAASPSIHADFTTSARPARRSIVGQRRAARRCRTARSSAGGTRRSGSCRARVSKPGLAADRAVDHREQRRRHVPDRDAAQQRRGREARQVADHAAADRRRRRCRDRARPSSAASQIRSTLRSVLCSSPAGRHHASSRCLPLRRSSAASGCAPERRARSSSLTSSDRAGSRAIAATRAGRRARTPAPISTR